MRVFLALILAMTFNAAALAQQGGSASIKIDDPWARATPASAKTGAVYLKVENTGAAPDRLTGGSSPVAASLQVHEMKMEKNVMRMRPLPNGLPIPAKGSVSLSPGGYHIMLTGLKKQLKMGETVPVELTFEHAGKVSVNVPVRAMGATGHEKMHNMGGMKMK
jgi:hypothetical protein